MSQHCSLSPNPSMNFARTSWRSWRCTALCCLFLVNVVFFLLWVFYVFVGLCWSLYCSSCFIALSAKCIPFEVAQRHARKPTGACPWPLNRKNKNEVPSLARSRSEENLTLLQPIVLYLSVCLSVYLSIYLSLSLANGATWCNTSLHTIRRSKNYVVFTAVFLLCSTPVQNLRPGAVAKRQSFCACGQLAFSGVRVLVSNKFQSNTRKQIRAEHVS